MERRQARRRQTPPLAQDPHRFQCFRCHCAAQERQVVEAVYARSKGTKGSAAVFKVSGARAGET